VDQFPIKINIFLSQPQGFAELNEATIESLFERILYALLKQIGLTFSPEKESAIATKRHIGKDRTDSRVGALIIEFKHWTALKT
jgi:hypothetical protein